MSLSEIAELSRVADQKAGITTQHVGTVRAINMVGKVCPGADGDSFGGGREVLARISDEFDRVRLVLLAERRGRS